MDLQSGLGSRGGGHSTHPKLPQRRWRPSSVEEGCFVATKPDSLAANDAADDLGHIPTLPFGTRSICSPLPAAGRSPPSENQFHAFRFLIPELPTDVGHNLLAAHVPFAETRSSRRIGVPTDQPERPTRGLRKLLLCAVGLVVFAFALLFWVEASDSPETVTQPRGPRPAGDRGPGGPAVVAADRVPAAPVDASQNPSPARTIPAQQLTPQSSAAAVTTHRQAPTSLRQGASKAPATFKKVSALSTVLAPPPVD